MEYIDLADLDKVVGSLGNSLPKADVTQIAVQLLRGLKCMHDLDYAHRDLNPRVGKLHVIIRGLFFRY
jgi:serine/threonine protein kinase